MIALPLLALGLVLMASPAEAGQPDYAEVPGSPDIFLNPSHEGAPGSGFEQDCEGLPRPIEPGEVAWHFILPQSILQSPDPDNIFQSLTVNFATAGTVTTTAFGPPSAAHAYIYTPTDDTLLGGQGDILRSVNAEADNEDQFNLSHTCYAPPDPPVVDPPVVDPPDVTDPPAGTDSGTGDPGTPELPSTGHNVTTALLAVVTIGLGVALVFFARRSDPTSS